MKSLAIIVPTFNEADNIAKLIKAVGKYTAKGDKIVIVDDNSPDGTAKIVQRLARKSANLFIIKRQGKGGRGSAVFAGFKFARQFKPSYYIEMDADFSHKPQDIPRLVAQIEKGSDIVIGSRYLPQSQIANWPKRRKIFSKLANIYAKLILKVPISDYTNGFRIYTSRAVDFLLSQKLHSTGYILLSETAFFLKKAGFKFSQIPIVFINRRRGVSNLNVAEIKNAFLNVWKIRYWYLTQKKLKD